MATQQELLNQASEIRDAELEGENTAVRVGSMLINIIEYMGQFMTSTQLETALQEVSTGLEEWLAGYAQIDSNSGLLDFNHSWFVPLATMGTAFDESPEEYTPAVGELYYKNQSGYQIFVKTSSGGTGYPAKVGVVYFNKRTGKSYKWNGSAMVELGTDAVNPHIIDYYSAPPFADIAVGQSYFYTPQNGVSRLAVKTGSNSTYAFDPDPDCIYCFKDTGKTMIWKSSSRSWQQVGGSDIQVINDLVTGGGGDALSAEMGKTLNNKINETANANSGDFEIADESGNVIMRLVDGHIKTKEFDSSTIGGGGDGGGSSDVKSLKILFIGNSFSMDAAAYVPFLVKSIVPDVQLTIGSTYIGGAILQQQYSAMANNSNFNVYYKSVNGAQWTDTWNVAAHTVLKDEDWDVVVFQQGSSQAGNYTSIAGNPSNYTTSPNYLQLCIDQYETVTGKTPAYWWLLTQRKESAAYSYADMLAVAQRVALEYPIDRIIPVGTAVNAARGTILSSLGVNGNLEYDDGGHLQDGLPVLLAGYTLAMCIFDALGVDATVVGSSYTFTAAPTTAQKNGDPVGMTDANRIIAQRCAVFANNSNDYKFK